MEQNKDKNISQVSDRNTTNITYCAEVDVKNIQAKKLSKFNTTMLYPYHSINGKVEPILTQTKSIILQNNATYNRNIKYYSDSDKKFILLNIAFSILQSMLKAIRNPSHQRIIIFIKKIAISNLAYGVKSQMVCFF